MSGKSSRALVLFAILLLISTFSAAILQGAAWDRPGGPAVGLWNAAGSSDFVVVRAYFEDLSQVAALTSFTEPWEVDREKGFVTLGITRAEVSILQALGYRRIEIDQALTDLYTSPNRLTPEQLDGIPGYPCYRTVEETLQTADDLAAAHPNLAAVVDAGDSWEKTQNASAGYDLRVLVLTNQAASGPKPALFLTSAIHAREYATAELVTRYAEFLLDQYGSDPDVTWLLDSHEIHLMLVTNPDGRKHAETGLLWRKNTNNNYCTNSNSRGADLNRNFEYLWGCCGGSSGSVCSEIYRGPSPGSEPEVQAVQNYLRSIFPDQKGPNPTDPAPADATGVYLDIHSYSELVLWPWGYTSTVPPNGTALQTLGRRLAYFNGYTPEQAIGLYVTDGTTDDFAYGDLGVAAYTYELGTSFFQDCGTFENVILPDNLESLLYAAKVARTPYLTPAGPEALSVAVSVGLVPAGTPVDLTATLDDTRFNNSNGTEPVQNIDQAEYYVDVPYWSTDPSPTPFPMSPADGSFNSPVEGAAAVVDTTGWDGGRHILYVRGKDAAGSWGSVGAAFLYVTTGNEGAFVGQLTDSLTAEPITGTVFADAIGASAVTDPTGVYTLTLPAGTWNLRASGPYHLDAFIGGVTVSDGNYTPVDFALDPTPGMIVPLEAIAVALAQGQAVTETLRIQNPGNLPLEFSVVERDGGFTPAAAGRALQSSLSVLLVDDDDNLPNVQPFYTAALDQLGAAYTVFNVGGGSGNGPTAAVMAPYDVVIWFSGDQYGSGSPESGPNAADEVQLADYLANGGKLLLISQDYHYDMGLTSFMTGVLGVGSIADDSGDYASVSGQNAFGGLGPYTLAEPGTDYSDAVTAGSGTLAFIGNNAKGAGLYTLNTVFLAFQWEGIANASPAAGAESLQALLDHLAPPEIPWLDAAPSSGTIPAKGHLDVTLTFSAGPPISADGLYTGTLTINGNDPANPSDQVALEMTVGDQENGFAAGTIQLQGRADHSGVPVRAMQGANVIEETTTNSSGFYTLSLPPGTYNIEVEMAGYLDSVRGVTVTSGGTNQLGTLTLLGGDTNDDDVVDILDISFMSARYGLACGDAGYDPMADANADCLVNIQDLSIAGGNFGKVSHLPW